MMVSACLKSDIYQKTKLRDVLVLLLLKSEADLQTICPLVK